VTPVAQASQSNAQPIRVGVLTNPSALHNDRFPYTHRNLLKHLQSSSDAVVTADASQVDEAVRHLMDTRQTNVLAINGGDGTIHATLNSLVRQYGNKVAAGLRDWPILLFLNGGTYNMASRALGTKGHPARTLERFASQYPGATISEIKTQPLSLLDVHPSGQLSSVAMVFGSDVVAHSLSLCDDMGAGYRGLTRLFVQGALGVAFKTRFLAKHAWRLAPPKQVIQVDGEPLPGAMAAVASTIDLKLVHGLVWAFRAGTCSNGFPTRIVRADKPLDLLRLLPYLLWQLRHSSILDYSCASLLRTDGPFTVDGEIHDHDGAVEVRLSPHRFRVVSCQ